MANKAISELPQAQNVNNQDLFVLEQSGIAKKLTAETFITEQGIIDALAEALDGHGGISSVTLSSVSGRIRTYLITFADGTTTTFQVLDGTSITSIQKTSTSGLVDTYTVYMSDGTTSFFNVTNGSSIASVQKTSTSGLVDTYTITLTNGSTQTFTVTNGARGPEGPAGDYAGIVGRDSLTDAAADDALLIYDVSAELEKKITVSDLENGAFRNVPSITDCNTAKQNVYPSLARYATTQTTANTPSGKAGVLITYSGLSSYHAQWYFTNGTSSNHGGKIWFRHGGSSTWNDWTLIADYNAFSNLAWVETGNVASRAYAIGDYFVNSLGVLCKITAAVASGGTLTSGTNYTAIGGNGGLANNRLEGISETYKYHGAIPSSSTKQWYIHTTASPQPFILIGYRAEFAVFEIRSGALAVNKLGNTINYTIPEGSTNTISVYTNSNYTRCDIYSMSPFTVNNTL